MKATELRIGNWVLRDNKPIKIVADKFLPISLETLGKDYIKPIPLTEEWLIKFGFGKRSQTADISIHLFNGWELYFDEKTNSIVIDTGLNGEFLSHINHVHQLQNLYHSLTGEELTKK